MQKENKYAFLSYSTEDKEAAFALRMLLRNQNIPTWMAPFDIPAGSSYGQVINDALENCGCMVLLISDSAQQSPFVERELERAISYRKNIVPFWENPVRLNSSFRYFLGSSQIETVGSIRHSNPRFGRLLHSIRLALDIPEPEIPASGVPVSGIGARLMEALESEREWRFEKLLWQDGDSAAIVVRSECDSDRRSVMQIRTLIRTLPREGALEQADLEAYEAARDQMKQYMEEVFRNLEPLRHCSGILFPITRQIRSWSSENEMGEDMIFRFDWHVPLKENPAYGASVPVDVILKYGKTLAGALAQLHDLGISHRNVCMDSLYVNRYDGVRLGIIGEMLPVQLDTARFASGFRQDDDEDYPEALDVTALGQVLAELLGDRMHDRDMLTGIVRKAAGSVPGEGFRSAAALRKELQEITYKTPFILQRNPAECGAAALSMIFSRLGVLHSLDQLCAESNVSADGISAGDMMRAAKQNGLECHGYRKTTEALYQMIRPCILHWEYNHFVVLEELWEDCALLNDPDCGHRFVSRETLDRSFTGVVLTVARV